MLEISFQSIHLSNLCASEHFANTLLGVKVATKLRARLSDISVSEKLTDLPVSRPQFSFIDNVEYIIIKIDADIEAGFICVQSKPPKNPDNTINWDLVKRIKLMFIGTEK